MYYRRGEVPPSKFKGPFDKAHQRQLAAWSFEAAQVDRPRSPNLSLSPCTTLPDYLNSRQAPEAAVDQARPRIPGRSSSSEGLPPLSRPRRLYLEAFVDVRCSNQSPASPTAYHDEYIQDRQGTASLSSTTAVDPESFSDSTMTLFDPLDDDSAKKIKQPVRNPAPIVRSAPTSPLPVKGKGKPKPFAPEDLSRALNAVQICS